MGKWANPCTLHKLRKHTHQNCYPQLSMAQAGFEQGCCKSEYFPEGAEFLSLVLSLHMHPHEVNETSAPFCSIKTFIRLAWQVIRQERRQETSRTELFTLLYCRKKTNLKNDNSLTEFSELFIILKNHNFSEVNINNFTNITVNIAVCIPPDFFFSFPPQGYSALIV